MKKMIAYPPCQTNGIAHGIGLDTDPPNQFGVGQYKTMGDLDRSVRFYLRHHGHTGREGDKNRRQICCRIILEFFLHQALIQSHKNHGKYGYLKRVWQDIRTSHSQIFVRHSGPTQCGAIDALFGFSRDYVDHGPKEVSEILDCHSRFRKGEMSPQEALQWINVHRSIAQGKESTRLFTTDVVKKGILEGIQWTKGDLVFSEILVDAYFELGFFTKAWDGLQEMLQGALEGPRTIQFDHLTLSREQSPTILSYMYSLLSSPGVVSHIRKKMLSEDLLVSLTKNIDPYKVSIQWVQLYLGVMFGLLPLEEFGLRYRSQMLALASIHPEHIGYWVGRLKLDSDKVPICRAPYRPMYETVYARKFADSYKDKIRAEIQIIRKDIESLILKPDFPFENVQRMDSGAQASVYKLPMDSGRQSIVKVHRNGVPLDNFVTEIAMQRLAHTVLSDKVPEIEEYGVYGTKDDKTYWVRMSLIDVPSWEKSESKMSFITYLEVLLEVAEMARILAENGIFHFDMMTRNVLVDLGKSATVFLIDFGIAMPIRGVPRIPAILKAGQYQAYAHEMGESSFCYGSHTQVYQLGYLLNRTLPQTTITPEPLQGLKNLAQDSLSFLPEMRPTLEVFVKRLRLLK